MIFNNIEAEDIAAFRKFWNAMVIGFADSKSIPANEEWTTEESVAECSTTQPANLLC